MSLTKDLQFTSSKMVELTEAINRLQNGLSPNFIQRKAPMFKDEEEAKEYLDDLKNNPEKAQVTLIMKELEGTINDIRWT